MNQIKNTLIGALFSLGLIACLALGFNDSTITVGTNTVANGTSTINGVSLSAGGVTANVSMCTNNVWTSSTNYTLKAGDTFLLLAGNLSATLPTAVGSSGKIYVVKCTSSGTNAILTTSSQTIDGANSWTNTAVNKFTKLVSDGTNWWVVGQN